MSRLSRLACLTLLAACEPPPVVPNDATLIPYEGGTLDVPDCDHQVRTGIGATAPELAGSHLGDDPSAIQIHLGLAADPRTSMVIVWRTQDDDTEAGHVSYWSATEEPRTAPGITWRYRDRHGASHRVHEAHLCDLRADTSYTFRVEAAGVVSPEGGFRTAPERDEEVVFVALGDARGDPVTFGQLLAAADERAAPDLILFTGDGVANGSGQAQWDALFAAAGDVLARRPILLAVGNHEDGDVAWGSLWALPGDEQFYTVRYGPAAIVVLDDSSYLLPDETGRGEAYLREVLPTLADAPWRIAMHHQPIYSAPSFNGHGSTPRLQQNWAPLYDEHAVDLVLNGHDHKYERTVPLRAGVADPAGATYIVTGAAGAPLYAANFADWTAQTMSIPHYIVLRVRPTAITAEVYSLEDALIDQLTLSKSSPQRGEGQGGGRGHPVLIR